MVGLASFILIFEAYRFYVTTDQKVSLGHIRQIVGLYSSYLTFFPFSFFDDAGGGLRLKTFPLTRQLFELPYSLDDKNCLMVVSSSLSLACSSQSSNVYQSLLSVYATLCSSQGVEINIQLAACQESS